MGHKKAQNGHRLQSIQAVIAGLIMLLAGVTAFAQNRATQPVDFSLPSIDGQTVTSASLRGEVVVLAFGASWLPLSRTQLQGVRKLADEYSNRGVVVYWVSTESDDPKSKNFASDEQLRAFSQKYGLKVTVLRDHDGVISKKFGVDQLPSIVILDKEGNMDGAPIGGLDPGGNLAGQLASRLDKLL
ncbi:MAG TPA: TlpA disulfide reductase family protein [Pyrinomonadaceae bacterium]|jgi:peroxiredoxin|nr:TlpA disulfide reductase family protein [Pyrinomonadaceae bacterium]